MHPDIHIHAPAVVVAALAVFFFGWIWHGPLFGKTWAALMKFPSDFKPTRQQMIRSMVLSLAGSLLTAFVLAHSVEVWRPSVWRAGQDQGPAVYGFFAGFFTWLGFYVPMLLAGVAWEGRPWKLFGLNAAYHFVALQIMGAILAFWR